MPRFNGNIRGRYSKVIVALNEVRCWYSLGGLFCVFCYLILLTSAFGMFQSNTVMRFMPVIHHRSNGRVSSSVVDNFFSRGPHLDQQRKLPYLMPFTSLKATKCLSKVPDAHICYEQKRVLDPSMPFKQLFRYDLPEGDCVGIKVDENSMIEEEISSNCSHWLYNFLHLEEIQYGLSLNIGNIGVNPFLLGRLAMRQLLRDSVRIGSKIDSISILRDKYGRPMLPQGHKGSISHKKRAAVALVTNDENSMSSDRFVGVDIELITPLKTKIGRRILTKEEATTLGNIPGLSVDEETLLRFSLKESVYKAIHPLINQYVGFKEAEIIPHVNGTASVRLNLKNGAHSKIRLVSAHWRKVCNGKYFLTSASASA